MTDHGGMMDAMEHLPPPDHALGAWPHASVIDIGPPAGVDDDECGHAYVLVNAAMMGRGMTREHRAFFKPTPDDLERLNEGGYAVVTLIGAGIQPFACATFPAAVSDHEPAV